MRIHMHAGRKRKGQPYRCIRDWQEKLVLRADRPQDATMLAKLSEGLVLGYFTPEQLEAWCKRKASAAKRRSGSES